MDSPLPAFPMVANTDYSPSTESFTYPDSFDKAYLADFYTTSPDHSLDTFLDCDTFFDRPVSSVEYPASYAAANGNTSPITTTNLNAYRPAAFNPAPFGQLEQDFGSSFPFDLPSSFEPRQPACPRNSSSQTSGTNTLNNPSATPSLCGDGPPVFFSSGSPPVSPPSLKRESPEEPNSAGEEPQQKRPQRKRGRPRLNRTLSDTPSHSSTNSSSSKYQQQQQRTSRLPHNQVERKYREGLNSELERLRRAVPTLPQSDEGGLMGQPKPSKAMVLAGAIEYIRKIERERDALLEENEKLSGGSWRKGTKGDRKPKARRQDSGAEFVNEDP